MTTRRYLSLVCSGDVHQAVHKIAHELECSASAVLRTALMRYLADLSRNDRINKTNAALVIGHLGDTVQSDKCRAGRRSPAATGGVL